MKTLMKTLLKSAFTMTLLSGIFALGCSSSSNGDDASTTEDAGDAGPTLFGITPGKTCFDVVSVKTGFVDGCNLGVGDTVANNGVVGAALLVNYDPNTATLTVGTDGSLGTGTIAFNEGTLNRVGNPSLDGVPACTWHQTDTSNITVTATNEFDLAGTEVQNMFATACGAANTPTGGTCTSTWTWHMKIGTKTPTGDGSATTCP
jgi:hypothetical protein